MKSLCAYLISNQVDGLKPVEMQYSGSFPIPPSPHFFWIEDRELLQAVHEGPEEGWSEPSAEAVLAHYQGGTGKHTVTIADAHAARHVGGSIWNIKGVDMELLVYVPVGVEGQAPKIISVT